MLFYKVTAKMNDEKWQEKHDRIEAGKFIRQIEDEIQGIIEDYNRFNKRDDIYILVSEIRMDLLVCGVIASEPDGLDKKITEFIKKIDKTSTDLNKEEITLDQFRTLCRRAEQNDFIIDEDEVYSEYGLEWLIGPRGFQFGENLIEFADSERFLINTAEELLSEDTLVPEIKRIYAGKKNLKAYGNPVHYFIETDIWDTRKMLYKTLLKALYANNRLKNRRYCYVDFDASNRISRGYDDLYKISCGGAIVIRCCFNDEEENEYAGGQREIIRNLCEKAKQYRNSVLTIFCLPRSCEKIKRIFRENLGNIGMIEIKENLVNGERAKGYLNNMCSHNHIRADRKLYEKLEDGKMYLPNDLYNMFDEWYNNKLRTSVFSQYKDIQACKSEAVKEKVVGNAYGNLNEMIGLTEAKSVIDKAINYYKIQKIYKDKGINQDKPAMHMVFTGNPGTAKTTVARLFARIMKENGLLSKGHLVEVGRSDLVGRYVGWTAPTVKEKFKKAKGGVLFIDEAYSLVEDRDGLYGDEAINTIVQEMENMRDDLVVIFAGYPEEMNKFLNKNPGLRSRIAFHIPFSDYNADELCDIAKLIGKNKGVTFTDGAYSKMHSIFEVARNQPDFGNGRYVRNIIELSKLNQAERIVTMNPEKVTESILTTIEEEDISAPHITSETRVRKIGFN